MYFIKEYFLVLALTLDTTSSINKEVTLAVNERIQLLKDQINKDISNKKYVNDPITAFEKMNPINKPDAIDVDYEDDKNELLTPIMENDTAPSKFLTKKVKTKPSTTRPRTTTKKKEIERTNSKNKSVKRKSKKRLRSKVKEIFYRRIFDTFSLEEKQFVHCQDLITPYYLGHKRNMTERKRIPAESGIVKRLVQLLKEVTPEHTKEDIYSIMYQISKLSIRLFQWEIAALKSLCKAITGEPRCYHKNIKYGLKNLFASWHLDFTNTTNLLKQARLFRPPCVAITPYGGSTKSPRSTFYKKATEPQSTKRLCLEEDDDNEECN